MIFKKSGSNVRAMIAKFEADLRQAKEYLEELDIKIADASIEIAQGVSGAREALAKYESDRTKAESEVGRLQKTLARSNELYADTIQAEQRKTVEKQWADCKALALERSAKAQKFFELMSAAIEELKEFKDLGCKLYEMAPSKDLPLSQSYLGPGAVDTHFRFLLLSRGFHWAASWTQGEATIPRFQDKTEEAHKWILKFSNQIENIPPQKSADA